MIETKATADALTFHVYVQPRASAAAFAGSHLDALKVKLTAPPADGAANKQCLQMLAKALGIPKSRLEIVNGLTHRRKQIRIALGRPEEARQLIDRLNALTR